MCVAQKQKIEFIHLLGRLFPRSFCLFILCAAPSSKLRAGVTRDGAIISMEPGDTRYGAIISMEPGDTRYGAIISIEPYADYIKSNSN